MASFTENSRLSVAGDPDEYTARIIKGKDEKIGMFSFEELVAIIELCDSMKMQELLLIISKKSTRHTSAASYNIQVNWQWHSTRIFHFRRHIKLVILLSLILCKIMSAL